MVKNEDDLCSLDTFVKRNVFLVHEARVLKDFSLRHIGTDKGHLHTDLVWFPNYTSGVSAAKSGKMENTNR